MASTDNITIYSLAPTIGDWSKPPLQTATLTFGKIPAELQDDQDQWHFTVPGQPLPLLLDSHFLDFTSLNHVDDDHHAYDCIGISGLASHPFGSWRFRDRITPSQSQPLNWMWLRDQLPVDIESVRVLTYGYDTKLSQSHSFQTIDDIALFFILKLSTIRPAGHSRKPLIFFAHSLGGIVLKSALLHLAGSGDYERSLLQDVSAIIFFGVPSSGMHTLHLLSMVEGQPNLRLIESLSKDSEYLSDLNNKLSGISLYRRIRLVSAYETEMSPTVIKTRDGTFARHGKREILVSRESAVQAGSDNLDVFPINRDHSNIVKFSPDDSNYGVVLACLRRIMASTDQGNDSALSHQPTMTRRTPAVVSSKLPIDLASLSLSVDFSDDQLVRLAEQSLAFKEIDYRAEEIETAHSGTCDWIFDSDTGFVDWLYSREGYYWIRGKPGSGKSCLMKFLHDDKRCEKYLNHWTRDTLVVSAWFFFHQRGSLLQKSWEGLLRSVMYQLMQQSLAIHCLLRPVCLNRAKKYSVIAAGKLEVNWPLAALEQCLSIILDQDQRSIDVVLFLDALDEYNDPPELIAEALKNLAVPPKTHFFTDLSSRMRLTRIKICFSSRPWDVFMRRFSSLPGFFMHKKSEMDIRKYVVDKIMEIGQSSCSACAAKSRASRCRARGRGSKELDDAELAAVEKMVTKAEGVFLWIRLVLDQVRASFNCKSTPVAELVENHLDAVPSKLEDMYEQTLQRIPLANRAEAFVILEIVYRSSTILFVEDLYCAVGCGMLQTYEQCQSDINRRQQSGLSHWEMASHLKNLCGGLLEVLEVKDGLRIQFIHRTVTDFVGKPGFGRRLFGRYHYVRGDNGHSVLVKFYLSKLSRVNLQNPEIDTLRNIMIAAHNAESTTGAHQATFLDSVPESVFQSMGVMYRQDNTGCDTRLTFATNAGLKLYILNKAAHSSIPQVANDPLDRPLLHAAVTWTLFEIYICNRSSALRTPDIIRFLLDNGASDTLDGSFTAFTRLFQYGCSGPQLGNHDINKEHRLVMCSIAEAFLECGQDPNVRLDVSCPLDFGVLDLDKAWKARKCTPLHLARSPMTNLLLKHGANVNAKDEDGLKPLDIGYGAGYGSLPRSRAGEEMVATVMCLIEYGAEITVAGKSAFHEYFSKLHSRKAFYTDREFEAIIEQITPTGYKCTSDGYLIPVKRQPIRPTGARIWPFGVKFWL